MAFKFNPLSGSLDLVLDQASEIKYIPSGDLVSTNVQDAIDEVENQILTLPDPIVYKGTWDAATNTPALANSDVDVAGFLYQVQVAGTVDFGAGPISFEMGDKVVSNGTEWQKWDMTDAVLSVNGEVGVVLLDTTDIPEGTNLYFTDERAQDAVGAIVQSTDTIDITYDDTNLYADVIDGSITNVKLATGIDATKIADGSVTNAEFQYLSNVTSDIQAQLDSKVEIVPGDITQATFTAPISAIPADVTGAVFANAVVRSFDLTIDAVDNSVFESFTIKGLQRNGDWMISQESLGDIAGIAFSITNAGQIQYISNTALTLSFKANVVGV